MEDKERTLYCGNLSDKVTEDLLYELFLQAGPLETVTIPKEKDGRQRNYGFIKFKHAVSVPYAVALMNGISLHGKVLRLDNRIGSDSTPNPYLEQLRQYQSTFAQQSYHQNDNRMYNNRARRHDSRRYESRPDNDISQFKCINSPSPMNVPILYPGYNQQYASPQNFSQPAPGISYPPGYGTYPNAWSF